MAAALLEAGVDAEMEPAEKAAGREAAESAAGGEGAAPPMFPPPPLSRVVQLARRHPEVHSISREAAALLSQAVAACAEHLVRAAQEGHAGRLQPEDLWTVLNAEERFGFLHGENLEDIAPVDGGRGGAADEPDAAAAASADIEDAAPAPRENRAPPRPPRMRTAPPPGVTPLDKFFTRIS